MPVLEVVENVLVKNSIVTAFLFVGLLVWFSYYLSKLLTRGRLHGSAVAITLGLVLAYLGGYLSGGSKGIADIAIFSGVAVLGGAMFRDFAIVATAFGADLRTIKKAGVVGAISIVLFNSS